MVAQKAGRLRGLRKRRHGSKSVVERLSMSKDCDFLADRRSVQEETVQ